MSFTVQLLLPPAPLPTAPSLRPVRRVVPVALAVKTSPPYPAILGRPLFSPSRSGVALAGPAAPVGAFALLGVAMDGRRAIASLRDATGTVVTLRPGESVQGWRLEAVGHGQAVLRLGTGSQTLQVGAAPAIGPVGPAQGASGG